MRVIVGPPYHTLAREARRGKADVFAHAIRAVEDMGFWGLMIPHHISDPGYANLGHAGDELVNWRYHDPIALLGYQAAVSRTAKLVTWVMVLPYRRPIELAHGLASADSFSGGQLVFGAGVGMKESEFQLVGVPLEKRGRMADEWLEIIIELWTNPKASYSGRHYSFKDVTLTVRRVQQPRPPIWIGGGSPAAVRRAIRFGDVWAPPAFGGFGDHRVRNVVTARELKEDLASANDQRSALGKPPLEATVSTGIPIKILPDGMGRAARARKEVAYFTSQGTVDELLEEFQAYRAAGARSVIVHFDGDPAEFLKDAETFAGRIMSQLGE